MTKVFERAAAIVELPPTPPAYVVMYEVISADRCTNLDCAVTPPGEPPHDGHDEDTEEGPRDPLRINVSENAILTESLTVLIKKGSDAP